MRIAEPGTKIAVEREQIRQGIRILMWNDRFYYTCVFTQHEITQATVATDAVDADLFRMHNAEAQALCQALHDAGFKPEGGEGTSAHVQSMKDHIEDLQHAGDQSNQMAKEGLSALCKLISKLGIGGQPL